jgi:PD-(D/E)XK endonuclease
MAPLKQKGDRAELEVARDLVRRGYRIAIPYGEDWDFDLIFQRPDSDALERVQVKHTRSDGCVVAVKCSSHSLTNGRIRKTKRYTARMIDWLAVYDASTERCFYVPAAELGEGRWSISLRLRETKNGQSDGIRYARAYADPDDPPQRSLEVEPAGLEPAPSRMQTGRSPN